MAQVQLSAGIVLVAHLLRQLIHFLRQDRYAATHFVVAHFGDQHLFADLVAVGRIADPIVGQTAAHLIEGHVVLLRNVGDRFIELLIGHLHTHFLTHLQHDLIHDQTLEDLMTQRRVIWKLLTCFTRIELHRLH
ncbi:hypothetical protein D3C72_1729820 [compost metagenome]